jgi:cytochrome c5
VSHEDKVFMGNFIGVLAALVVIAVVFYFVAHLVTSDEESEGPDARMQSKIEENIKPVGEVNVGTVPAATTASAQPAAAAGPRSGEQIYNSYCMACHGTGMPGAPQLGDSAAWNDRASKGIDGLLSSATTGLNAMPPKGTCADCSQDELEGAIQYMLSEAGL